MFRQGLVLAILTTAVHTADAQVKGCPTGTAVQGIDFGTKKLVCTPVGGAGALKVVDARGVEVGIYAGTLLRLIGNEWISLAFFDFGFQDQQFTANFESADCSGPFYLNGGPGPIPRSGATVLRGSYVTVYVPSTFTRRTIRSFGNFGSAGVPECIPAGDPPGSGNVADVADVEIFTIPAFTPPFRIAQ